MLSPQQLTAIEALLEGLTQQGAAKRAGVSRNSVVTWWNHNEEFQDAYNRAIDRMHRGNVAAFQKASTLATDKLVKIIKTSDIEANVIRAAIALADLGFKAAEHFRFDERLRKQEEKHAAQSGTAAEASGEPQPGGSEADTDRPPDVVSLPAG